MILSLNKKNSLRSNSFLFLTLKHHNILTLFIQGDKKVTINIFARNQVVNLFIIDRSNCYHRLLIHPAISVFQNVSIRNQIIAHFSFQLTIDNTLVVEASVKYLKK